MTFKYVITFLYNFKKKKKKRDVYFRFYFFIHIISQFYLKTFETFDIIAMLYVTNYSCNAIVKS